MSNAIHSTFQILSLVNLIFKEKESTYAFFNFFTNQRFMRKKPWNQ